MLLKMGTEFDPSGGKKRERPISTKFRSASCQPPKAEGTDEREEMYGQRWGRALQRTSLSMTSSAEMQSCGLADGSLPAMYRWISDVGRSPTWVSLIYMTDTSSHQNYQFLPPAAAPHRHHDCSRYKCLLTRYVSTLGPAAAPPSSPPPPLPPASRQPHHYFHQILPALSIFLLPVAPFLARAPLLPT